ncbi:MAG: PorT family protein [Rikenellaceae bacterium]
MKRIVFLTLAAIVATATTLHAQHTFGLSAGWGYGGDAIYPAQQNRSTYGLINAGVSWRTYSESRVVGCFGIDLQYIERAFSISPSSAQVLEDDERFYYTRHFNTIMIPIVWQPHFYMVERRVRIFGEAAVTFSYDLSSTYDNDFQRQLDISNGTYDSDAKYSGKYEYMTARDNRLGYGLYGGGGVALLFGKYEFVGRVRYYIGLSDVVRNRNKYYSNNNDGNENPFSLTPIRSSLNGLSASFGVNYHFGPAGFASWDKKRIKSKIGNKFDYKGEGFTNKSKQ